MSGANNTVTSMGGPAAGSTGSMGELMCYAGAGNTYSVNRYTTNGLGLQPPKMAVEFDMYPNGGESSGGCNFGREDGSSSCPNCNHNALMFWGTNCGGNTNNTYPCNNNPTCPSGSTAAAGLTNNPPLQASYDHNVHGAGNGTNDPSNPSNSASGDGTGGYCQRLNGFVTVNGTAYNWMEDGLTHGVRVEITRATTANQSGCTGGTYAYNVKEWVDCEGGTGPTNCCTGTSCTSCPLTEYANFENLSTAYTNASYPPKINRTVCLSSTLHSQFGQIIFGFTEATGAATQAIQIANFAIYFPCCLTLSPTSASYTHAATTGNTVTVTAASSDCTWTATSLNSWITVTSPASSTTTITGSGTVTYSVAQNTSGAQRTGTIQIGCQSFTITQSA
jgi:hypothetical protein